MRKHFSGQEKIKILKRHLLEGEKVSDLCDEYDLHPNVFYSWQKQLFERGEELFNKNVEKEKRKLEKEKELLCKRLKEKNEVVAEILEELLKLKKKGNGEI